MNLGFIRQYLGEVPPEKTCPNKGKENCICSQCYMPTTPEKKCCDGCGVWYDLSETGERKRGCINTNCDCHKELPTSSYEVTCGLKTSPRERIQAIATELEHSTIRNRQFGRTIHSQATELYLQEQYEKSIKHSCGVVRDWQSEREDYLSGK